MDTEVAHGVPLSLSLSLSVSLLNVASAADATCVLDRVDPRVPFQAELGTDDGLVVRISGESEPGRVVIEGRAWFGGLEHSWAEEVEVPANECTVIPVSVPRGAWLHDLASSWVTDVFLRVVPLDEASEPMQESVLPPVYAVWPEGPDRPPLLFDADQLRATAPMGVLDPTGEVAAAAADLLGTAMDVRLVPPIGQELNRERSRAADQRPRRDGGAR
jgi:hypothetical protein